MTTLHFIILILAAWRTANLFAAEDGPKRIFEHVRHAAGVRYDEYSQPYGTNELSKMMLCVWCSSIWIGLLLIVFYLIVPEPTVIASLPFSISAGAIVVDEICQRQ